MRRRLVALVAGFVLTASTAAAYYHYVHYGRGTGFLPVPQKFDLSALPNRTVTFLVSDNGPVQLAPGDSFASVLAQISEAARAWNSIETSELRVAFGGLFSPGIPQSVPGGEVVFDELPPGVFAVGGPTSRATDIVNGPNGPFVPILRATVRLNRDLTRRASPSYTEAFYGTVVHEMGHALGLQHTLTSSAMSTWTRTTYRLHPIEADDVAGMSVLYPTRNYLANTGAISGRVLSAGQPVHLASVVAIRPGASAISTLTNPDGTYQLQGLPQDQYYLYVTPLPAPTQEGLGPGDIVLPLDPEGRPIPATGAHETLFFPASRDPQQSLVIPVLRGGRLENLDFSVQRRAAVTISDPSVFSYFGSLGVKPAFLSGANTAGTLVVRGTGIMAGGAPVAGLDVQVLGGLGALRPNGIRANDATSLALYLSLPGSGSGPRHLVFLTPSDAYVFPSAFYLTQRQPPVVASVSAAADGTVSILGANIGLDTRFFFDGVPGVVRSYNGAEVGTASVVPPQGAGNRAAVVAYNPDGQNSTFLQAANPATYQFDPSDPPLIRVEPAAIPAGSDAMVEVTGLNTRFVDGQTMIGFGSGDIQVRRVWVLSPTRMLASVSVSAAAPAAPSLLNVVNGFQISTQPFGFQVVAANPRAPRLNAQLQNMNAAQTAVYPGSLVNVTGANLVAAGTTTVVTVNDVRATVVNATPTQVTFQIPSGLPPGPAVIRLFNGQENALPVVVGIDTAPVQIVSVSFSTGRTVDAIRPGDLLNLVVSDPVGDGSVDGSRLRIRVGELDVPPLVIAPVAGPVRSYQVMWMVPASIPAGPVAVSVRVDDRVSEPVVLAVRL